MNLFHSGVATDATIGKVEYAKPKREPQLWLLITKVYQDDYTTIVEWQKCLGVSADKRSFWDRGSKRKGHVCPLGQGAKKRPLD